MTAAVTAAVTARLPALLLLFALVACAAPQTARLVEDPADLPRQVLLEDVPFFPQTDYYCGPAVLAMTLTWSGLEQTPDDLVSQVYTPGREGTLAPDIVAAARRHGRLAVELRDLRDLLSELAAGNPVIVFQNLALDWWPQWHFAVAIGYDLDRRVLVLHSGTTERLVTPLDAFERTWARSGHWALLTLPPDQLPASGGVGPVLVAAAGLEQVQRHRSAAQAYGAALGRWPGEPAIWIGKGNALFALKRFAEAEAAFRTAVELAPRQAAGWNNLAYALSRQGRREEAVAAARRAVDLAQGDDSVYRDTLKEVSGP